MAKKQSSAILIWSAATGVVLLLLIGSAVFATAGYAKLYQDRIFPGVRILGVRLDGMTADEARTTVNKAIDGSLKDGLRFRLISDDIKEKPQDIVLNATTIGTTDPDASRDLVHYNIDHAIVAAMSFGRGGNNVVFDALSQWEARVTPINLDAEVTLDEPGIKTALLHATDAYLPDMQNASLEVHWNEAARHADVSVTPEHDGRTLNTDQAIKVLRVQAHHLAFQPIDLRSQSQKPTITTTVAETLKDRVPEILNHAPFVLTYADKKIMVTTSTLAGWIGVVTEGSIPTVGIATDRFAEGIRKLAPDIEKTAKPGSLEFADGKIKSFIPGTEGIAINDQATIVNIHTAWEATTTTHVFALKVTRTEPALSGQDPERLGIKELIGVGHSNFSGSPTNRRKNIANGIKKIDGTIIAPGEEFSLLKTLGPIEDGQGWFPELVIKGNKTEPELGGGLCQIGTTAFRGALSSGLPITMRQNHSYRVRYYEPAGTDATIYDPMPDFRFKNDMNTSILIHAYSNGDELTYEFWGTKDGRSTLFKGDTDVASVDALKPRVSNIIQPPPMKLVETLDLKPGEKKCTEVAHNGADAEFDYDVTYADGHTNGQTFRSHYRPWQAVCLIGVEKLSEPVDGSDAVGSPDSAAADAVH
jgi:vancomycin resistance protein YoaR